jgi:hypothetical protein
MRITSSERSDVDRTSDHTSLVTAGGIVAGFGFMERNVAGPVEPVDGGSPSKDLWETQR